MTSYIESFLGWLLYNLKKRDAGLFTRTGYFQSNHPDPSITITSPDCGASGCELAKKYGDISIGGENVIPSLSWAKPSGPEIVAEYLLIVEDVDVPIPWPIVHGVYYGIPATMTSVTQESFEVVDPQNKQSRELKGGFKYGKNLYGNVYIPPRPILSHGPHRYIFTVIALKAKVDTSKIGIFPKAEQIKKEIEGKILAWGEWYGTYEQKR